MLCHERVRALATEFGGNWLDFRRFEEHNSVDRQRFSVFTNELRQAMFEEPIRYFMDVARRNRSILDLLYGNDTPLPMPSNKPYEALPLAIASVNFSPLAVVISTALWLPCVVGFDTLAAGSSAARMIVIGW